MTGVEPGGRGRSGPRILLMTILVLGTALRLVTAFHHQRINFDEGRYLDNAVHLLEGNGLATSTLSHFFGDPPSPPRPEDMSSPAYPLVLSGLFLITGASFAAAKVLSLIMSVASIPLAYLVGKRIFGEPAGLGAAAGIALQPDQAIVGTWTMTEPLYTCLLLLCMLAALGPLNREKASPGFLRLIFLGFLLGLLYLTRQNGAAVAVAMAALLFVSERGRGVAVIPAAGRIGIMALAAFLLCLPWFARNAATFGSPLFTRMKNVAWADHGRSLYTLGAGEPSMSRYMEEHGFPGLARNMARRAERVLKATLFAETGPYRWLALLGFASPFLAATRRGAAVALAPALLSALLLVGVAPWSGALPRYLLPIRPLLYAAGAASLVVIWRGSQKRLSSESVRRFVGPAALLAASAWAVLAGAPVYAGYMRADQGSADTLAREASEWIRSHTEPGDLIMEGGFVHQYAYRFRRGVIWIPYGSLRDAFSLAEDRGIRYLILSAEILRFRPGLGAHWRLDGSRIVPEGVPAGLVPVFDRAERGLMIYRFGGPPRDSATGHEPSRG